MTEFQDHISEWAVLWGRARGHQAAVQDSGVLILGARDDGGSELVVAWPGGDAGLEAAANSAQRLTLAASDARGAKESALRLGLKAVAEWVLLTAPTASIAQDPDLPDEAHLASAPMEGYDVVEIAVFDHPVCTGRISVGDEVAVIAKLHSETPEVRDAYEPSLLAALAEEAYFHGAGTLYLIVDAVQADRFPPMGWRAVARLLSFEA